MKRTALVFSVAMLLSGASVFAKDPNGTDLNSNLVDQKPPVKKSGYSYKLPDCTELKAFASNRKVWLGSAAVLAASAIAYKLYKNYKKNAAQETEENA